MLKHKKHKHIKLRRTKKTNYKQKLKHNNNNNNNNTPNTIECKNQNSVCGSNSYSIKLRRAKKTNYKQKLIHNNNTPNTIECKNQNSVCGINSYSIKLRRTNKTNYKQKLIHNNNNTPNTIECKNQNSVCGSNSFSSKLISKLKTMWVKFKQSALNFFRIKFFYCIIFECVMFLFATMFDYSERLDDIYRVNLFCIINIFILCFFCICAHFTCKKLSSNNIHKHFISYSYSVIGISALLIFAYSFIASDNMLNIDIDIPVCAPTFFMTLVFFATSSVWFTFQIKSVDVVGLKLLQIIVQSSIAVLTSVGVFLTSIDDTPLNDCLLFMYALIMLVYLLYSQIIQRKIVKLESAPNK